MARHSVRKLDWINCLKLHICKTTWLLELDLTLHIVIVTKETAVFLDDSS